MSTRTLFWIVALFFANRSVMGEPYWVQEMRLVHSQFMGAPGTIARFGDSITYSGAFFKPLRIDSTNRSPNDVAAQEWLQSYVSEASWSWQDDAVAESNGNFSGTTSSWPLQTDQNPPIANIQQWLQKLEPELAIVMWGTNDLHNLVDVETYTSNMRTTLQTMKDFGTIPLLTTIPPRRGYEAETAEFVQAMRDLAFEVRVPLIDYNQAILDRRPGATWDGTLISSDGVHPSAASSTLRNFSESALRSNGYLLRNYVTLHGLYEAYSQAIAIPEPSTAWMTISFICIFLARRR